MPRSPLGQRQWLLSVVARFSGACCQLSWGRPFVACERFVQSAQPTESVILAAAAECGNVVATHQLFKRMRNDVKALAGFLSWEERCPSAASRELGRLWQMLWLAVASQRLRSFAIVDLKACRRSDISAASSGCIKLCAAETESPAGGAPRIRPSFSQVNRNRGFGSRRTANSALAADLSWEDSTASRLARVRPGSWSA